MVSWSELDLISTFAFVFMYVTTMVFWSELDLIFTLFCLQVINLAFWIKLRLFLHILLPVGDLHSILEGVGVELHPVLHAVAFWIKLDMIFTFFCL